MSLLFNTATERERFFREGRPMAGDAIRHASSVRLGIWGSIDQLRADTARIMAMEIHKFLGVIMYEQVSSNGNFSMFFEASRIIQDAAVDEMISKISGSSTRVYDTERWPSNPSRILECADIAYILIAASCYPSHVDNAKALLINRGFTGNHLRYEQRQLGSARFLWDLETSVGKSNADTDMEEVFRRR